MNRKRPSARAKPVAKPLTDDEVRVIQRMHAEGFGDQVIAEAMGILPRTVRLVYTGGETWEHVQ